MWKKQKIHRVIGFIHWWVYAAALKVYFECRWEDENETLHVTTFHKAEYNGNFLKKKHPKGTVQALKTHWGDMKRSLETDKHVV
ncbi:hypothetical protein OM416_19915 [Paenibacillus sp. LS1]|uniref:hypothetical protein n=1 Tax=Paenibacillus sp. LS1 TaxID=2992120 RepID=UPI00222F3854|nr:hypothetical protein [Paenibacillus sp. LS1]MCW3793863.1 hypothetical protein [Paenibacillus sp. LS1]